MPQDVNAETLFAAWRGLGISSETSYPEAADKTDPTIERLKRLGKLEEAQRLEDLLAIHFIYSTGDAKQYKRAEKRAIRDLKNKKKIANDEGNRRQIAESYGSTKFALSETRNFAGKAAKYLSVGTAALFAVGYLTIFSGKFNHNPEQVARGTIDTDLGKAILDKGSSVSSKIAAAVTPLVKDNQHTEKTADKDTKCKIEMVIADDNGNKLESPNLPVQTLFKTAAAEQKNKKGTFIVVESSEGPWRGHQGWVLKSAFKKLKSECK